VIPGLARLLARPCLHVAVDMQRLFAEPGVWPAPGVADILPRVVRPAGTAAARSVGTRWVPGETPEDGTGAWRG